MGYSKIFWINEAPIRNKLKNSFKHLIEGAASCNSSKPVTDFCTADDRNNLFAPIGKLIIQMSLGYGKSDPLSLPFEKSDNVFNHVCSLHSSMDDGLILMWSGNRLFPFDRYSSTNKKIIEKLEKYVDNNCFIFPLNNDERNLIVNKVNKWDNPLATKGEYSIYWIDEDDTRDHDKKNDAIVGEKFLNLMLSNWRESESEGISKVCTITYPQFRFFIWAGKCLNTITNIIEDEYFNYLKKDGNNEQTT